MSSNDHSSYAGDIGEVMTDIELKAIMCARDMRTKCMEEGIIKVDTKKINYDILSKLVNMYNGQLTANNNYISYFQKQPEDSFVINIADDIIDEEKVITVLQGLGIRIFSFNLLTPENIIRLDNYDFTRDIRDKNELAAIYLFAREFLMPRELFEDSIEDNIGDDNICDYKKVAIDFNTSHQKVLIRKNDMELE